MTPAQSPAKPKPSKRTRPKKGTTPRGASGKRNRKPPAIPPEPWEQQPKESDRAFANFQAYRDMDRPRAIRRLAQDPGRPSAAAMMEASRRWEWQERVEAYDRHVDRAEHEALLAERVKARKRAVRTLSRKLELSDAYAAQVEKALGDLLADGKLTPEEFIAKVGGLGQALHYAGVFMRADGRTQQALRLELGLSTDKVEVEGSISTDVAQMSDSQIDDFLLGVTAGERREREKMAAEA